MNLRRARTAVKEISLAFRQSTLGGAEEIAEAAYDLADSADDDESAAATLRARITGQSDKAVGFCLDRLARGRESRAGDRAYRLLNAAVTGKPVEGLEPSRADLFETLAEMETVAIEEAYTRLVDLVPDLGRIAQTVERCPRDETEGLRWHWREQRRIAPLVGLEAGHPDPLVNTHRMMELAVDYLQILAGDTTLGGLSMSEREIRKRRLAALEARPGTTVEPASGGMVRVSMRTELGKPDGRQG